VIRCHTFTFQGKVVNSRPELFINTTPKPLESDQPLSEAYHKFTFAGA
jgi:hypothetical protein